MDIVHEIQTQACLNRHIKFRSFHGKSDVINSYLWR